MADSVGVSIDEFVVGDAIDSWASAGFAVDRDGVVRVGGIRIRLAGAEAGTGILGWSLRGLDPGSTGVEHGDLDGVATTRSERPAAEPAVHPNGVLCVDHAVLLTPDLSRTVAALGEIGLRPRRERDAELAGKPIRQVFYRLGEAILEVVGPPGASDPGPSRLWGLTFTVADLDETAAFFGDHATPVKEAVQPGRRITTLRHQDFSVSVATALISAPAST